MTYDEFYGHVVAVFSSAMTWRGENTINWYHGSPDHYQVEWRTGGMCGGNCWGDSADHPVDADPEPDMPLLDQLLEEVCPDISFIKYKHVLNKCVKHDTTTMHEYYGNYTMFAQKRVNFRDLYDALVKVGAWQ